MLLFQEVPDSLQGGGDLGAGIVQDGAARAAGMQGTKVRRFQHNVCGPGEGIGIVEDAQIQDVPAPCLLHITHHSGLPDIVQRMTLQELCIDCFADFPGLHGCLHYLLRVDSRGCN